MTARNTPKPDHFQGPVGGKVDPDLYEEEVQKLRQEPRPPLERKRRARGSVLHAGEPLQDAAVAVCTDCELEIAFPADTPVTPCQHCGSETFRVVS